MRQASTKLSPLFLCCKHLCEQLQHFTGTILNGIRVHMYVCVYLYTRFDFFFCFAEHSRVFASVRHYSIDHTGCRDEIGGRPKWYSLCRKRLSVILCPGVKSFKMPDLLEVLKIDITVEGIMFAGDSKKLWIAATWHWLSGIIMLGCLEPSPKQPIQNIESSNWALK